VAEPSYAIIAGVNKAGTSSLFVSLSQHPSIAPSAIKETRYFLPARYGRPLEPASVWEEYFAGAPSEAVRLEATPSYVYGSTAVATCINDRLPESKVIVALREPVARAISFFEYQKVRLRLPSDMPMAEYLAIADALTPDDFLDPDNEKYMAFRGGCYAEFLPPWLSTFGTERVAILGFEDIVQEPARQLRDLATFLGIDPDAFPSEALSSENRTVGYRNARMQRVALTVNDRLERLFRKQPGLERRLRATYYRVNGRARAASVPDSVRAELAERYDAPNQRLEQVLRDAGAALPRWLGDAPDDPRP
jgi:Sulfotransferase domain